MGPEASANLYHGIIKLAQKKYGAVQDTDYPEMFIYSLPLEGFDEKGIIDSDLVLKQLIHGVKTLENAGSDVIIMACNTVHLFIEELCSHINIPILSMIEETVKKIKSSGIKSVALLGSETTLNSGLYTGFFDMMSINYYMPDSKDVELITNLILQVMKGDMHSVSESEIKELSESIKTKGVQAVVLGCTELPLVLDETNLGMPVFDTSNIIIEAALDFAMKNEIELKTAFQSFF